jgi:hypothetical protein
MKPLSKKQRSFSLTSLLLIFFIAIPFLLAYSAGYRINWEDLTFVKTGGVFIHSDLSGASVFINDEFSESGGVLLKNILVQNLKSNETYKIRVEKEGYNTWYKELFVHPNLVIESRILMIPLVIPFEKVEQFVYETNLDPKIKATSTKVLSDEYEETLDLFTSTSTVGSRDVVFETEIIKSTSTNPKATSTEKIIVPKFLADMNILGIADKNQLKSYNKMVAWLEEGDIYVAWSGDYESTPFFFCDVRGCRDRIIISLDTDIREFDFFPGRNDAFVLSTGNNIFAVEADDRSKPNLQNIFEGKKPEFKLDDSTIFIKDGQDLYTAEI